QIAALTAGEGHAGIVIAPEAALPDTLGYRRLFAEALLVAAPQAWLADGRLVLREGQLGPDQIVEAPLILFPRRAAPAFHDLVTGYFTAHGGSAHIVQEAIQMQTIISLVSAEMGLALVPASLRNLARTGVCYVPLAGEAPLLETGLVWRLDDRTPTLANFLTIAQGEAA
ncbi:MAG: LysR substrate-binding domain-containing protein, partial [Caulobacteraceae bacterium]|nr:LysR substrate-binding domain-containing protein [Caulobacteraceae bacterium]